MGFADALKQARNAQLRDDVLELQKAAALKDVGPFLARTAPHLIGILGATALTSGLAYHMAGKRHDEHKAALKQSKSMLPDLNEKYQKAMDKFRQRFDELAVISPMIAANPQLANKVIEPRLHKGFNLDDIHRLSAIEYHTGQSPRVQSPGAAAKAQAMIGIERAVQNVLPGIISESLRPNELSPEQMDELRHLQEDVGTFHPEHGALVPQMMQEVQEHLAKGLSRAEALEKVKPTRSAGLREWDNLQKTYGAHADKNVRDAFKSMVENLEKSRMKKEGAATANIGDECLGRMLADTHNMCKEAGLLSSVSSFLKPSAKNIGNYMKAMTIPLAIGVGVKALQGYMDSRSKSELRAEADKVFAKLRNSSDIIGDNAEIAMQAFDSLKSFAPALAVKPIIAKTFVENVVNSQGHLDPNTANMLAQTQQAVQSIDRHSGGFIAGLREPMSLFDFKVPGKRVGEETKK